jgi:tetratricopeptide (TPR) repeat protein
MVALWRCELVVVLALTPCTALAAGQARSYRDDARAAYLRKDYPRSEELYLLALQELGGKDRASAEIADILDSLCIVYNALRRYSETEALYTRALEIREQLFGPESLEAAGSLNRLAHCYNSLHRLDVSITLQNRAVRISEKNLDPRHTQVAYGLEQLARFCNLHGDHDQAEKAATRALGILEEKFGQNDAQCAGALTLLGAVYLSQQRFDEAESAYIRALKLRGSGSGTTISAFDLNNLALLYRKTGKYDKAERLHLIGLEALEAAYGANSPCLLSTLQAYGILLTIVNRRAEAQAVSRRMEQIAQDSGGQQCRP